MAGAPESRSQERHWSATCEPLWPPPSPDSSHRHDAGRRPGLRSFPVWSTLLSISLSLTSIWLLRLYCFRRVVRHLISRGGKKKGKRKKEGVNRSPISSPPAPALALSLQLSRSPILQTRPSPSSFTHTIWHQPATCQVLFTCYLRFALSTYILLIFSCLLVLPLDTTQRHRAPHLLHNILHPPLHADCDCINLGIRTIQTPGTIHVDKHDLVLPNYLLWTNPHALGSCTRHRTAVCSSHSSNENLHNIEPGQRLYIVKMENNSQTPSSQPRPSGLPRPSRLPVPGQSRLPVPRSTSLRTSPSRESLPTDSGLAGTSLQSPRLRSTTSRDQLASTTTSRRPQSMLIAPSRVVSSPHANCHGAASRQGQPPVPASTTRTTSRHSTYISPSSSRTSVVGSSIATSRTSQTPRTLAPKRQPSRQSFSASTSSHALHDTESIASDDSPTSAVRSNSSLIERTIETLSQLPSSPSVRGKSAASFYSDGIPKGRTSSRPTSRLSRPGSSHQSHESLGASSTHGSRPGSRLDNEDDGSSFHGTYGSLRPRQSVQSFNVPAVKKAIPRSSRMSLYGDLPSPVTDNHSPKTPSPEKPKSAAPRALAKRTSVYGLSKKPSVANLDKGTQGAAPRKASMASQRSAATSVEGSVSASSGSTATSADTTETSPAQTYRKPSSTLREQIAKAKAAAKKAAVQPISESAPALRQKSSGFGSFGDDLGFASHNDPFNQHRDDQSQAKVLQARFATARTSGRLNIAAMGLKEIPIEVLKMFNLEAIGATGGAWAECVDLTRFVAADNELEMISDTIFPDVDPQEMVDDEDSEGNIFAGLETLDLHGNILVTLPMGLRQLRLLTSLNLVCAWVTLFC